MRESNIKARIKNILNYKKLKFWVIFGTLIILLGFATGLLSNPLRNKKAEARAEEFLTTYYTIDNTDIADLFLDYIMSGINYKNGLIDMEGVYEALKIKYSDLMTENGFEVAASNSDILAEENTARIYDSTMEIESINILDEETSKVGGITYQYSVPTVVKFKDGDEELVNYKGSVVMMEVEGVWKVDMFNPIRNELDRVLIFSSFGISSIYITNESDASIKKIELVQVGSTHSTGRKDKTDIKKGKQYRFRMTDENNVFTINLFGVERNLLATQKFIIDFSEGKDVYLYIYESENGKLVINEGETK